MECVFSRLKGRSGALRRPLDINLQNFHMLSTPVFFNIIFVKSTRVCVRRQSSCSHFIRQRFSSISLSYVFSKFIVKKSSYFSCFLLPIRIQTWRWVQTIREQIAVLTSWHRLRIFQLSICCTISGGRALGRNNRWFKSNENAGVEAKKMMRFW